jgi:hypothetical protein
LLLADISSWDELTTDHQLAGSTGVALTSGGTGGAGVENSWNFDNGIAAADPGKGKFRFSTATPSTATALYMDTFTAGGMDFANYFRTFTSGTTITIQDNANAANWVKYTMSAAPVDNTGWWTLAVTYVASGGVLPNNNGLVVFLFQQPVVSSDPWATALPGSYGAGSAGAILGNNLNATITSRMATFVLPGNFSSLAITAAGAVTVGTNNDKTGYSLAVAPPTAAAIATAVWTDTTAGDFATLSSPGKVLVAQLGGAFTTTSSSVYTTAALANAPTGGGASAAVIASAVWQDITAGDFTVAGSIGKSLFTAGNAPGAASGLALVGSNMGSVTSVTSAVTLPAIPANWITAAGIAAGALVPGVWDASTTGHTTAGTFGGSLNAAGSAGDPWATSIPGAYGIGTAGHRLGNIPDIAAGAAGGIFIAGTNAGTTVNFTGNLSGSVGSVTSPVTVGTNNDKSGYSLGSAGLDSIVVEAGINARQALALIGSASAGKSSGVAAGSPVYQSMGGTATRISATASNGDRSTVTLTPPP